ncbi:MAG TPA: DUF1987 domain-containing protein [Rhodocyclaceae bacterium]|nr:DUF1987 domain-containing protein [Rhodocyclaceae bacterium]
MEDLYIAATNESPEIDFAFSQHRLRILGESYPENALSFYGPIRSRLEQYLGGVGAGAGQPVEVHFALKYFNSSSTKLIRLLVAMLHEAAAGGARILMHWHHDPDDDMMLEYGMDLREEFRQMEIRLVAVEAG